MRSLCTLIALVTIGCVSPATTPPRITAESAFGLDGKPGPSHEEATTIPPAPGCDEARLHPTDENLKQRTECAKAEARKAHEARQ